MARLFSEHGIDAMLAPTLPTGAIDADRLVIEGTGLDESVGVAWTRLTMPFNATGQPVLAIPCGLDSDGLPMGSSWRGSPGKRQRYSKRRRWWNAHWTFIARTRPWRGPRKAP